MRRLFGSGVEDKLELDNLFRRWNEVGRGGGARFCVFMYFGSIYREYVYKGCNGVVTCSIRILYNTRVCVDFIYVFGREYVEFS